MKALRPLIVVLLACAAAPLARAQTAPAPSPEVRLPGERDIDSVPEPMRIGARAEVVRRSLPVESLLVIATDEAAYVDSIARWSPTRRFPVLLDDGSIRAARDIARFTRGFRPERILEVSSGETGGGEVTRERVEKSVASAWAAGSIGGISIPAPEGVDGPPGVAVASLEDPAWPAAVALGAGRGLPLVWLEHAPRPLGAVLPTQEMQVYVDRIEAGIASLAESQGFSWSGLGDDVDALALCLNAPLRYRDEEGEERALTDRLGRHADQRRWAWAGQITGDPPTAAYRAMCALFLQPSSVWMFDGYRNEGGFAAFDVQPAAESLRQVGITTYVDARPAGAVQWRRRASRPVNAGFVHINTAGGRRTMNLNPGRVYGSDVPRLSVPSIVHVVHSFSAQDVTDLESIAGRFLAHGAYAYVGAVHEPYLNAFHPPQTLLGRLGAPAPLGAAARLDGAPVWKIAVLGDPLLTLGPAASPAAGRIEIEGATRYEQIVGEAVGSRDFAAALRGLLIMGRDGDAVRLTQAVLKDEAGAWTAEMTRLALPALFRRGETDLILRLYRDLPREIADFPLMRDLFWMAMRPAIEQGRDASVIETLSEHMRPQSFGEDAGDLAAALARIEGEDAAVALLSRLMEETDRAHHREAMERALKRLGP